MSEKFIRYYKIAEITIQVESDLPILDNTFSPAIREFEVNEPGDDLVVLRHHFTEECPINPDDFGRLVYDSPPWKISKGELGWVYREVFLSDIRSQPTLIAFFSLDFSTGDIYHRSKTRFDQGSLQTITNFPTDQIYIGALLNERIGFFIHSAGVTIGKDGLLFVGHSEAGKSTSLNMLRNYKLSTVKPKILCDDRNIIRLISDTWIVSGSWDHGTNNASVSSEPTGLTAILFLEKASTNVLTPITNKSCYRNRILEHIIKPMVTEDWWDNALSTVLKLTSDIPAYTMKFDTSGDIIPQIHQLVDGISDNI